MPRIQKKYSRMVDLIHLSYGSNLLRCLVLLLLFGVSALTAASQQRALIIGDSISRHYTATVRAALAEYFEVSHNEGNAKNTSYSLQHIDS